jgi:hypothetical protein
MRVSPTRSLDVFRGVDAGELHEGAAGVDAHRFDRHAAGLALIGGDERDGFQVVEAVQGVGPRLDARFPADAVRFADHADGDAAHGF